MKKKTVGPGVGVFICNRYMTSIRFIDNILYLYKNDVLVVMCIFMFRL